MAWNLTLVETGYTLTLHEGVKTLADMLDTLITDPEDGQGLFYDTASGKWVNEDVAEGGGAEDIGDLTTVGMTPGNLLAVDNPGGVTEITAAALALAIDGDIHILNITAEGAGAGNYFRVDLADEALQGRTPGQVLTDIGAAAAAHSHSYQPVDAELTAIAGLSSAADKGMHFTGAGAAATHDQTAFARTLLDDADQETARGTLGLVIDTNVQSFSAKTAALAALTWAANSIIMLTGAGTAVVQALAAHVITLLQSADAGAARLAILAAPLRPDGIDIAGTSHTFALTNEGAIVRSTSGSTTVFTVPLNSAVAFPTGTIIGWSQKGTGELSFAATGGVTIYSLNGYLKAAGQHAEGALRKTDVNTWDLIGALKA